MHDTRAGTYPDYRIPAEIISQAVWLYHVLSWSLRDVELIVSVALRHLERLA